MDDPQYDLIAVDIVTLRGCKFQNPSMVGSNEGGHLRLIAVEEHGRAALVKAWCVS